MRKLTATALAFAIGLVGLARAVAQEADASDSTAAAMRQLGQAMMIYSLDYKGYLPPDVRALSKYIGKDAESLIARAEAEFVYTVPPGTRLVKLKPADRHPLAVQKPAPGDAMWILFADGG